MYFTWDNMKYFFFCVAFLLSLGQLVSCSDSGDSLHSPEIGTPIDSLSGLLLVKAADNSVLLGTNDITAKSNERPQMKVSLNYDFSIGKSEVTCGEFNAVMKSVTGLVLDCKNDSLPATDVTYYDAVLFANARSNAEKRDTAYFYNKASFDDKKHCTNLDGFAFLPEVDAYRLPTEAEWVLVASAFWNTFEGWTAENSEYKLHKVCSALGEGEDFCDMAGNAMEWVNDWLGNFRDTVLTNYVGAPDGGSLGHRIVKGGSYRNSSESIKLYNRGDVYIVTSSTRADYVGFRLAFGSIPDATWMGSDGKAANSRIVTLANSSKVRSLFGSYKVKLAFSNNPLQENSGNLAFIDYSSGILSVTEIIDTFKVFHPEISPDGNKVAFCTGLEGNSGKSKLYVRDLNASGSNLVKLDVESAAIPRWRVLDNGDTVIVYVTDAGDNEKESKFKAASTWQVKFANGKFGKPEKLFDGAYHGGISENNTLAVTGSKRLRARIAKLGSTIFKNAIDTIWYNNEQACNASLAKDGSKRTLFLDFGSKKTGREFVGENYRTHERLLIADSSGKLVQSVAAPSGYTFDHTEWILAKGNFVVATLVNINGLHTKIVLVNLDDGSIVDLVEGDELWHPALWVRLTIPTNEKNQLDPDSACVYMTETSDIATRLMKVKMDYFWQYRDTAEIVIIGSSRSFAGMDAEYVKSGFAVNMAYSAQDLESTLFFVKNYILPLMPKLKVIALTLDYDRWYVKDENFKAWFADIPGYEYDKNHDYWQNGLIGDMRAASQEALSPAPDEYELYGYHRGLYKSPVAGWGNEKPEIANAPEWFDIDKSGYVFNLEKLTEILSLASNFDVLVVGVVYPQSPNFLNTNSWGRYGPTRQAAKIMEDAVLELAKTYPNFVVLDEYHDGHHNFTSELFSNEDHLGLAGAQVMAQHLDSLLKAVK